MYVTTQSVHPQNAGLGTHDCRSVHRTISLAKGARLFCEGDSADRVYEVQNGILRLTRVLENGRRQVIAFGYPGDIVGFPHFDCHNTDCDALTPSKVLSFNRKALDNGDTDPALHARLMQAALREINAMQDHFMMLGRKSATEKVASFLCVLSARVGVMNNGYTQFDLPMCRGDIADFLGTTTETVSRALTRMRKSGMIALPNSNSVILRNPRALQDLADGAE